MEITTAFLTHFARATPLNNEALQEFLTKATPVTLKKGDLLARVGQPVVYAYFMENGVVRHFVKGKKNREFTKNFIHRTGIFLPSLSDFYLRRPATIYCDALTDIEALRWHYDDLMAAAHQNPAWQRLMLQTTVMAFAGKERKEIALNQLSAKERYLQFQLDFPELEQLVPQHMVASFLNVTPETLSRIRAQR